MKPLIFNLFGTHPAFLPLASKLDVDVGEIFIREFPDGETYLQFKNNVAERKIILFSSLDRPNQKILPLLFAAKTAKKLGAKQVGCCAPYLSYMRQDKQFKEGEAVTSDLFAELLSMYVDWIVTVDPHLHRHKSLNEIYSISNSVLHATAYISAWIKENIENPILIGPDAESEQWLNAVSTSLHVPYLILEKIRHGDNDVEVSTPAHQALSEKTPVLIDDIISTARTMIETLKQLQQINLPSPICIGVHAVFAGEAYQALQVAGAKDIITCNTIPHESNRIDLSSLLASGVKEHLQL